MISKKFRAVDLFCGAGGMTLGAERSNRVDVVLAINHWRTAILSHERNHPNTRHICTRIEDMDLRNEHNLPEVDVIMGGIECVQHSNARGSAPINDQRRTSAWRVIDWIGRFRPQWCVFENVREFMDWGQIDDDGRKIKERAGEIFTAWVAAIRAYGYHVEWKLLNASHYGEATRRNRLFIICRRGGSEAPFKWPAATHGSAEEIAKTLTEQHRCNFLYERPAADIIDWSRPCPSIFDRKRPLAEKTLRRIEAGIRKFVEPYLRGHGTDGGFVVPFGVNMKGTSNAFDINGPGPTITAGGRHVYMAMPFIGKYHNGMDGTRNYSPTEPLRTLDTENRYCVTMPFMTDIHNQRRVGNSSSIDSPMPTVVAKPGNSLVMPFMLPRQGFYDSQKDKPCRPVSQPLGTITANHSPAHLVMPFMIPRHGEADGQHPRTHDVRNPFPVLTASNNPSLVMPYLMDVNHGGLDSRCYSPWSPMNTITTKRGTALVHPFLTKFYGTGGANSVNRPLDTVTAKHRHALTLVHTMQELGVVDIGFRMLDVDELAAAQGFPPDYYLHGTKADQVRQVGNAVCPKVMQAICGGLD